MVLLSWERHDIIDQIIALVFLGTQKFQKMVK